MWSEVVHMEEISGKTHISLMGIDIIAEKVGNQVIMYAIDVDNSKDELVSWTTVVHEDDCNECVQTKEYMGEKDPVKATVADFAVLGICVGDE